MGLKNFFGFNKNEPTEQDIIDRLRTNGRITEGVILETTDTGGIPDVVVYQYTVHGVDFESSDVLTEKQRSEIQKYVPGAKVSVRYDPKNNGISTLE